MKKYIPMLLLAGLLGCKPNAENDTDNKAKAEMTAFGGFKERFVEAYWQMYPGYANSLGYHKYDSVLRVPDAATREREATFLKSYLDSLHMYKADSMNANDQTDYYLIENQLQSGLWSIEKLKSWQWDPSAYNVGESFALLLTERYAALDKRLESFGHKLERVPAYYEAAKNNIDKPTLEHTELAIQQNKGALDIFNKMLEDSVAISSLTADAKSSILDKARKASEAINSYIAWLEKDVMPGLKKDGARSFRLGEELYKEKFTYDLQSQYSPEELYEKARIRKAQLHDEMMGKCIEIWPRLMGRTPMPEDRLVLIRKVLDKLSETHATPDGFQASVEKQLPELENFIKEKNLLYLDPSKPLVVRQTPDYMEGFSVASINAPGPYDKNANTYYNVGSLKRYSPAEAESFLKEYNKYTLQIINIHEAIPGHYTQLIYSNQSPSIIKSIFGNGSMVEGWAVYTERMMMEEGYGNNDPALWLMYYKWHLRTVCNTLLDIGLHTKNMSKKEAMDLLVNEAFQQQTEAEGKYRRATLSQVQLCSYFNGYTEIYELRQELKAKLGDKFSLAEFHQKFLGYGSAPVKYIRQLMLKEYGPDANAAAHQ